MLLEGGGGAFRRIYPGELPRGRGEMLGGLFIFPFERADALSQPRREQIAFTSVRQPRRCAEQSERRLLEERCVALLFVLSGRGIVSQTHNLGLVLTWFNGEEGGGGRASCVTKCSLRSWEEKKTNKLRSRKEKPQNITGG